jgi:hypothetical protein
LRWHSGYQRKPTQFRVFRVPNEVWSAHFSGAIMNRIDLFVLMILTGLAAGCATQPTLTAEAEMSKKLGKAVTGIQDATQDSVASARATSALGITDLPAFTFDPNAPVPQKIDIPSGQMNFLLLLCAPNLSIESSTGALANMSDQIQAMDDLAEAPPGTIVGLAKSIRSHDKEAKKALDMTDDDLKKQREEELKTARDQRDTDEHHCIITAQSFLKPPGRGVPQLVQPMNWLLSVRDLLKTFLSIAEAEKRAAAIRAYAHVFKFNALEDETVLEAKLQPTIDYTLRLAVREASANYAIAACDTDPYGQATTGIAPVQQNGGQPTFPCAPTADRIAGAKAMASAMGDFDRLAYLKIDEKVLPKLKEAISSFSDAMENPKVSIDSFFDALDNLNKVIGALQDVQDKSKGK